MLLIYRFLLNLIYPLIVIFIYFRIFLNKEDKNRFKEKLFSSSFNTLRNYKKKLIWFHVASIGGLKEKLLAAHRAGIKEVLIPKENEKDLVDMPKKIIDEIKITPVEFADEVLKIALTKELKKAEWVEVDMSKKDDKSQASIQ